MISLQPALQYLVMKRSVLSLLTQFSSVLWEIRWLSPEYTCLYEVIHNDMCVKLCKKERNVWKGRYKKACEENNGAHYQYRYMSSTKEQMECIPKRPKVKFWKGDFHSREAQASCGRGRWVLYSIGYWCTACQKCSLEGWNWEEEGTIRNIIKH